MNTNAANYLSFPRAVARFAVACAMLIAHSSMVQAQEATGAYTLVAYIDAAQGDRVTNGEFSDAITILTAKKLSPSAFEAHNNLCVSYTKTGDLENAAVACNAAVAARASEKPGVLRRLNLTKRQVTRDRAIALSNRGVLRAIVGDLQGAHDDFATSVMLDKRLDDPRANLSYLQTVAAMGNATAQNTD